MTNREIEVLLKAFVFFWESLSLENREKLVYLAERWVVKAAEHYDYPQAKFRGFKDIGGFKTNE